MGNFSSQLELGQAIVPVLALLVPGVSGAATPQALDTPAKAVVATVKPAATVAPPTVRYRIRSGDTLDIKVLGRPELAQQIIVGPDGFIDFPYAREIKAKDKTTQELKLALEAGLRKQIVNPQVLVGVAKREMGEVSVIGPVKEPGKHTLSDDMRVMNLIGVAGGLVIDRPEFVSVKIIRKGGTTIPVDAVQLFNSPDPQANPLLEDGDVLSIQKLDESQISIQVFGEVAKPGKFPISKEATVTAALADAGGPTSKAALTKAGIRRANGQYVLVDLSNPDANPRANLTLEPGDTLYVPQLKQVLVQGDVARPGTVDLPENGTLTLFEAIQIAGGGGKNPDFGKVTLTRIAANGVPQTEEIDVKKIYENRNATGKKAEEVAKLNFTLQPWDVIRVPTKRGRSSSLKFTDILSATSLYTLFKP